MKYPDPEALSEKDLDSVVASYFSGRGYTIVRNLKLRTWKPDIVAVRGDDALVIEVKGHGGDMRKALAQVGVYATDATSAYLAIPPPDASDWLRNAADALGIGLLVVADKVEQIVRPRKQAARPAFLARARRALRGAERREPPAASKTRPTLDRALRHPAVLDVFLQFPRREFTIREVATESATSYATTWRVIQDLVGLGVLSSKRAGHSNVVSLNRRSPVLADVRRLRSLELSPHRHAAKRFAGRLARIPQIRRVILFGSTARGLEGVASDVDVAVVVDRSTEELKRRVRRLAARVRDETGLSVMPILLRPEGLQAKGQFANDVRGGEVLYARR